MRLKQATRLEATLSHNYCESQILLETLWDECTFIYPNGGPSDETNTSSVSYHISMKLEGTLRQQSGDLVGIHVKKGWIEK